MLTIRVYRQFVPVAGAVLAFLMAFGIKWNRIERWTGSKLGELQKPRPRRSKRHSHSRKSNHLVLR